MCKNFSVLIFVIFCIIFTYVSAQQKHISTFDRGVKSGVPGIGCRKKISGSSFFTSGVGLCQSSKPLKPNGVLKSGKSLCADGWAICYHKDKSVERLSWKSEKMPKGCFALKFGDSKKPAGYGQDCNGNIYFNGVICCPNLANKAFPFSGKKADFLITNGKAN